MDPSVAPPMPQPVEASSRLAALEVGLRAWRSEGLELELELELESEFREARETREACLWARESEWVELMALRAAAASPDLGCADVLPEAAPIVNTNPTVAAIRTTAAITPLRRLDGRRRLPLLIGSMLLRSHSAPEHALLPGSISFITSGRRRPATASHSMG